LTFFAKTTAMNKPAGSQIFRDMVYQLVAASRVDEPVLLIGGVGTGKRQSAASIHKASVRSRARFVTVNCLGLSDAKFETEMFGAVSANFELNRKGAVAMAEGGTLYLHEVTELSGKSQALLVRFLETGNYCPVNGFDLVRANVRLISSSSVPLEAHVQTGIFRNELYHLISPISIHTPDLNDRLEDIPMLVSALLRDMGYADKRVFSEHALEALMQHSFNGNLIELRNILFRLVHNFNDAEVTEEQVRFCLRGDLRFESSFQEALKPAQVRADHWGLSAQGGLLAKGETAAPDGMAAIGTAESAAPDASAPVAQVQPSAKPTLFERATDQVLGEYADLNKPIAMGEMSDVPQTSVGTGRTPVKAALGKASSGTSRPKSMKDQERDYLRELLDHCKGDKRKAAQIAGLTLRTFYRKLEALDGDDE
jgi:DNA-binding NtrC family response regulator